MEFESQLAKLIIRPAISYAANRRDGLCDTAGPPSPAEGVGGLLSQ